MLAVRAGLPGAVLYAPKEDDGHLGPVRGNSTFRTGVGGGPGPGRPTEAGWGATWCPVCARRCCSCSPTGRPRGRWASASGPRRRSAGSATVVKQGAGNDRRRNAKG
ncbi:hypothetical protein ACU686_21460 [Yinghuangia aomiensis]